MLDYSVLAEMEDAVLFSIELAQERLGMWTLRRDAPDGGHGKSNNTMRFATWGLWRSLLPPGFAWKCTDQQGQPGLHVPSQHWPLTPQKSPWGQHVLPHLTLQVSMMVPLESRMTASQFGSVAEVEGDAAGGRRDRIAGDAERLAGRLVRLVDRMRKNRY